ncbi:hypothetical protein [Streptococcus acidominimus]|nr:hypothetical protein [Streptococcus acidominimus]
MLNEQKSKDSQVQLVEELSLFQAIGAFLKGADLSLQAIKVAPV